MTTSTTTKSVSPDDVLKTLITKFGSQAWFHSAEVEPAWKQTVILYAKEMSPEILKTVPERIDDCRVLLHFSSYKELVEAAKKPIVVPKVAAPVVVVEEKKEEEPTLTTRVWGLKKICGMENLLAILNEINAKAETKVAEEYPTVLEELGKLDEEFGYDVVYEEVSDE
jgi:hypothetical protein